MPGVDDREARRAPAHHAANRFRARASVSTGIASIRGRGSSTPTPAGGAARRRRTRATPARRGSGRDRTARPRSASSVRGWTIPQRRAGDSRLVPSTAGQVAVDGVVVERARAELRPTAARRRLADGRELGVVPVDCAEAAGGDRRRATPVHDGHCRRRLVLLARPCPAERGEHQVRRAVGLAHRSGHHRVRRAGGDDRDPGIAQPRDDLGIAPTPVRTGVAGQVHRARAELGGQRRHDVDRIAATHNDARRRSIRPASAGRRAGTPDGRHRRGRRPGRRRTAARRGCRRRPRCTVPDGRRDAGRAGTT